MREEDVAEAARIMRVAFGTHIGIPDPESFGTDSDYVASRFRADPEGCVVAELDGKIAGSNIATRWGSFGFFGPLTVRPDLWNQGIARLLLERTMQIFSEWGVRDAGLFTFANSAKHAALYQRYGFWARFLTAVMSKETPAAHSAGLADDVRLFSRAEADLALEECRELTELIREGLDLSAEIRAVRDQHLGDTLLLRREGALRAFAVCHCGEGTEAGSDVCYVKFGAARPSEQAGRDFARLLDACENFAALKGLKRVTAGVNMACSEAYRQMIAAGYRTTIQGVAMHRNNAPVWNRPGYFVLCDLR